MNILKGPGKNRFAVKKIIINNEKITFTAVILMGNSDKAISSLRPFHLSGHISFKNCRVYIHRERERETEK
jgi:hypothetical protein